MPRSKTDPAEFQPRVKKMATGVAQMVKMDLIDGATILHNCGTCPMIPCKGLGFVWVVRYPA